MEKIEVMNEIKEIIARVEYASSLARMEAYNRINAGLDSWIEEGKKVIYEEKHDEWESCVRALLDKKLCNDSTVLTHVQALDVAINVMFKLMTESFLDVASEFERKSYPINVIEFVRNLVLRFGYSGPEFFEVTAYRVITPDEMQQVQSIRSYNQELRKLRLVNAREKN